MSEEELRRLEQLAAAASGGPWSHDLDGPDPDGAIEALNGGLVASVHYYANVNTVARMGGRTFSHDDARFIAASRDALPALVAAVRAERARADEAERWCARMAQDSDAYQAGEALAVIDEVERDLRSSRDASDAGGRLQLTDMAAGARRCRTAITDRYGDPPALPPHEVTLARLAALEAALREIAAGEPLAEPARYVRVAREALEANQ